MSAFEKSLHSLKTGECRRLAEHIAAAAAAMGLVAHVDKSRQSASQYVHVSESPEVEDYIKIRCSDHDDRHGGSDWYAWNDECPSGIIGRLSSRFCRPVPSGYRPEDYAARSAAARAAAASRRLARMATEDDMLADVIEALRREKNASLVAAGKVVDRIYPAIPRAQRQRIASTASYTVIRDRTTASTAPNLIAA